MKLKQIGLELLENYFRCILDGLIFSFILILASVVYWLDGGRILIVESLYLGFIVRCFLGVFFAIFPKAYLLLHSNKFNLTVTCREVEPKN